MSQLVIDFLPKVKSRIYTKIQKSQYINYTKFQFFSLSNITAFMIYNLDFWENKENSLYKSNEIIKWIIKRLKFFQVAKVVILRLLLQMKDGLECMNCSIVFFPHIRHDMKERGLGLYKLSTIGIWRKHQP